MRDFTSLADRVQYGLVPFAVECLGHLGTDRIDSSKALGAAPAAGRHISYSGVVASACEVVSCASRARGTAPAHTVTDTCGALTASCLCLVVRCLCHRWQLTCEINNNCDAKAVPEMVCAGIAKEDGCLFRHEGKAGQPPRD
jgi:hypothetical protein